MFKILSLCFVAIVLPWSTVATSVQPCTTATDCKKTMDHLFKFEYNDVLNEMLREDIFSIENAADDIRKKLPQGDENREKLSEITKTMNSYINELNDIGALNEEKLKEILEETRPSWKELSDLNTANTNIQAHVDRRQKAEFNYAKSIFSRWSGAASITKNIDTSELPGFDAINEDVKKAKEFTTIEGHEDEVKNLIKRILDFYDILHLDYQI